MYSSISSNSYWVFSVSESFMETSECLNCTNAPSDVRGMGSTQGGGREGRPVDEVPRALDTLWSLARAGNLDNLTASECLNEYAQIIQSNRRNLLLVSRDTYFPPREENFYVNGSYVYWGDKFSSAKARSAQDAGDAYGWICSGISNKSDVTILGTACTVSVSQFQNNITSWRPGWYCPEEFTVEYSECQFELWPVEYCLSEKAVPHCKLHFEPTIAVVVTVLNLSKFLC